MTESAELLSLKALTDLDDALGRFGDRGKQGLDDVDASLRRQIAQLEERRQEAARQVRVCEARCACESDEHDADADAEQELEDARERLRLIKRWQRTADEACQAYRSVARRFEHVAVEHIPKARLKLRTKFDEAAAYLSVQLDGDIQPIQRASATEAGRTPPRTVSTPKLDSVVLFSLPPGFRWVPIEHISPRDNLGRNEGFIKVSEEDMRRAFGSLRRQVLPYLKNHPEASAATFRELDGYSAEGTIKPRQLAYQVFFGDDPIVLDGPQTDGTFSVTNGRHRIHVARDLGWPAVPARVIGKEERRE